MYCQWYGADLFVLSCFFFFNDTATTEIYTLSLHDALPISSRSPTMPNARSTFSTTSFTKTRSEEHTSELQSRSELVCRLLLEKKNKTNERPNHELKKTQNSNMVEINE